ncbi:MAG TPA: hypothetical protein VLC93_05855, partial [Myxococcota bacterium]|nr:hypothetical protein [Myxococcota bacterium]
ALVSRGEDRAKAFQIAWLRGGKLLSFIMGAALMFPFVNAAGYIAFAAPAAVLIGVAVRSFMPSSVRLTRGLAMTSQLRAQ